MTAPMAAMDEENVLPDNVDVSPGTLDGTVVIRFVHCSVKAMGYMFTATASAIPGGKEKSAMYLKMSVKFRTAMGMENVWMGGAFALLATLGRTAR